MAPHLPAKRPRQHTAWQRWAPDEPLPGPRPRPSVPIGTHYRRWRARQALHGLIFRPIRFPGDLKRSMLRQISSRRSCKGSVSRPIRLRRFAQVGISHDSVAGRSRHRLVTLLAEREQGPAKSRNPLDSQLRGRRLSCAGYEQQSHTSQSPNRSITLPITRHLPNSRTNVYVVFFRAKVYTGCKT